MTLEQKSVYRTPQDVAGRILVFLGEGPQKQTHVMYGCNLSYQQLKNYRAKLTEQGLIVLKENVWSLTPKGQTARKHYLDFKGACA